MEPRIMYIKLHQSKTTNRKYNLHQIKNGIFGFGFVSGSLAGTDELIDWPTFWCELSYNNIHLIKALT